MKFIFAFADEECPEWRYWVATTVTVFNKKKFGTFMEPKTHFLVLQFIEIPSLKHTQRTGSLRYIAA